MSAQQLPPACPKPCAECPWRQQAAAGYLGPHTAQQWLTVAQSEEPVACHKTLNSRGWKAKGVRQCRGVAAFRLNICKRLRRPDDATHDPVSAEFREAVFKTPADFLNHHVS